MRILMIHQSAELYGSDRSFLSSVNAIKEDNNKYYIKVLLPCGGPLVEKLKPICDEIEIVDFGVLRKSTFKANPILELKRYLGTILLGLRMFKKYDMVYLNTLVLMPFIIASRYHNKVVIHIRDIAPGILRKLFLFGLIFSKGKYIFNSFYLKNYFNLEGDVIYNGVPNPPRLQYTRLDTKRPLKLGFVGRINSWKGLDLLLIALGSLEDNIVEKLDIYGDFYPGQEVYFRKSKNLAKKINNISINFKGFSENVIDCIPDFDLLVVPSKEPEPFGRVVIEAMATGTPPLVAGHGGMLELVEDGKNGFIFVPNNIDSLKNKIYEINKNPNLLKNVALNSRAQYMENFNEEIYKENIRQVFEKMGNKIV